VTFTYAAIAAAALVFALVAGIKYNSVKVFNRSIRTENISNTLWILFYIFISLRYHCVSCRATCACACAVAVTYLDMARHDHDTTRAERR
jgi:presenilin-like A22 family membrane protease